MESDGRSGMIERRPLHDSIDDHRQWRHGRLLVCSLLEVRSRIDHRTPCRRTRIVFLTILASRNGRVAPHFGYVPRAPPLGRLQSYPWVTPFSCENHSIRIENAVSTRNLLHTWAADDAQSSISLRLRPDLVQDPGSMRPARISFAPSSRRRAVSSGLRIACLLLIALLGSACAPQGDSEEESFLGQAAPRSAPR